MEPTSAKAAVPHDNQNSALCGAYHAFGRVEAAEATLDTRQLVLAQGADLTHAAKCVQLADGLMLQSQYLAAHVQRAKDQAS